MRRFLRTDKKNLIIFGILFTLSFIISINLSFITSNSNKSPAYRDEISSDNNNLKISPLSEKIHIISNSGWAAFRNAGNCTGNGTYSNPYVIEDLVIDANGSGSCILIENSDVYFRIENCTVYNSGSLHAGIRLSNVINSQLIENNCSSNYNGIHLRYSYNNIITGTSVTNNEDNGIYFWYSDNNIIAGNSVTNNENNGIYLYNSDNNNISGNTANNNKGNGIYLWYSDNIILSGNTMNECGLGIHGSLEQLCSLNVNVTNFVNGKPLYYYSNEPNLEPSDFINAGQVILVNSYGSKISNLNVSSGSTGILLFYSDWNTISGNTANNNNWYGIRLYCSDYNTISGNTANYNSNYGIRLCESDKNTISGNIANYNTRGILIDFGNKNNALENNVANNRWEGIYLWYSNDNIVSGNTLTNNSYGIHLYKSNTNSVTGNSFIGTGLCIKEYYCQGNAFSDNGDCTYGKSDGDGDGDGEQPIPGYSLIFFLGFVFVVSLFISKKLTKFGILK